MTESQARPSTVVVFNFWLVEGHVENRRVAPFKATMDRIKALGGDAMPGTGESVSTDDIDAKGRYRRVATGWGELM